MAVPGSAKRECSKCGVTEANTTPKSESKFYLRKNGLVSRAFCKTCFLADMKAYHAATYPDRKGALMEKQRIAYAADPTIREKVKDGCRRRYLLSKAIMNKLVATAKQGGCSRCPEKDPDVLDLHHIDGSEKEACICEIRIGIRSTWTEESATAEIAKTICLCSNCHRKLHSAERLAGCRVGKGKYSENRPYDVIPQNPSALENVATPNPYPHTCPLIILASTLVNPANQVNV